MQQSKWNECKQHNKRSFAIWFRCHITFVLPYGLCSTIELLFWHSFWGFFFNTKLFVLLFVFTLFTLFHSLFNAVFLYMRVFFSSSFDFPRNESDLKVQQQQRSTAQTYKESTRWRKSRPETLFKQISIQNKTFLQRLSIPFHFDFFRLLLLLVPLTVRLFSLSILLFNLSN